MDRRTVHCKEDNEDRLNSSFWKAIIILLGLGFR